MMVTSSTTQSREAAVLGDAEHLPGISLSQEEVNRLLYPWQLRAVRVYDVQVERIEQAAPVCDERRQPALTTEIRVSLGKEGLLGRLAVALAFPSSEEPEYRIRCTLEGLFGRNEPSVPPPTEGQVDIRLASTILTLLWPYAREYLHDLMRRMEVPIAPLPMIDKVAIEVVAKERSK